MLRTISVKIRVETIQLDAIREERVVVLPDVETFSLAVDDDEALVYKLATHISCPSMQRTLLAHGRFNSGDVPRLIFPSSHCLHAIIRQYGMDQVEEIALEMKLDYNPTILCSLTFRSSDATALGLEFKLFRGAANDWDEESIHLGGLDWTTLRYATATVQNHPHLHSVRRLLLIGYMCFTSDFIDLQFFANAFRELIESMGPLDLLSISRWDPRIYLTPFFLDIEEFEEFDHTRPTAYPPIKELKISHPSTPYHKEECTSAIVEFAKSQHARGTPFERLELCMEELPLGLAGGLKPWVGKVDCYECSCEDSVEF